MISAISAALREHLARRPAQDIPALQASPKDWRPATCAIAAHIPRYATAHLARCRRCTPPTASIRSAAQAVRPMPAAARAADISAARDVVRGVCHGVHAVHVVAHDVCYVSRALHISCLPCAATVQTLAVSVPSVSSAVVFPTAVAIRAYPSLLSVNRPEKLACPWRVADMGGLLHDLQAIVGAEPEFLHEHAYDFSDRRLRFRRAVHGKVACGACGRGDGDRADVGDMFGGCLSVENADFATVPRRSVMRFCNDVDRVGKHATQPHPRSGAGARHGTTRHQR